MPPGIANIRALQAFNALSFYPTGANINGPNQVDLWQSLLVVPPETTADFTVPDFPGYAPVQFSQGAIYPDINPLVFAYHRDDLAYQFLCTGVPSVPQSVGGYVVSDGFGQVLFWDYFNLGGTFITISGPGDFVYFIVTLTIGYDYV
jgi:hypothetical protein